MYSIGSDFCLEDPRNTPFQARILCPLANVPKPEPKFYWSILFNDTELELDGLPNLHAQVVNENKTLILSGTIRLGDNGTLNIACTVENEYENDTEDTLISLCGEKSQCAHA